MGRLPWRPCKLWNGPTYSLLGHVTWNNKHTWLMWALWIHFFILECPPNSAKLTYFEIMVADLHMKFAVFGWALGCDGLRRVWLWGLVSDGLCLIWMSAVYIYIAQGPWRMPIIAEVCQRAWFPWYGTISGIVGASQWIYFTSITSHNPSI